MTTERFNVVLQGGTVGGQDTATVATELGKLIKRDTEFALRLLRGQPTTLKSGVDMVTGTRYLDALERIGAASRLEPETLEVDADLAAPTTVNQGQTRAQQKKVVDAGIGKRVYADGKFRRDEQQRNAKVVGPISTSDNTYSDDEGATLSWSRLWARQIDFALCCGLAVGLAVLSGPTWLPAPTNVFVQLVVYSLLSALVLIGYETLFLSTFGTTLGKAVLGLRVEARTGAKIDFGSAMRRSLGVWLRGCWAYVGFPGGTLVSWWWSLRHLRKTGSTPWDESSNTRVAGGPVPLWRATLAGAIAITAFTMVLGLDAMGKKEITREAQRAVDKEYGLSPAPAPTAAPHRSSTFDPSTARPVNGGFDPSTAEPVPTQMQSAPAQRAPAQMQSPSAQPAPAQAQTPPTIVGEWECVALDSGFKWKARYSLDGSFSNLFFAASPPTPTSKGPATSWKIEEPNRIVWGWSDGFQNSGEIRELTDHSLITAGEDGIVHAKCSR